LSTLERGGIGAAELVRTLGSERRSAVGYHHDPSLVAPVNLYESKPGPDLNQVKASTDEVGHWAHIGIQKERYER
jgi:hypothetical protein